MGGTQQVYVCARNGPPSDREDVAVPFAALESCVQGFQTHDRKKDSMCSSTARALASARAGVLTKRAWNEPR